jgi:catechol 2,3-dioxygenase-like lactoylglutathione lyase family enzyme
VPEVRLDHVQIAAPPGCEAAARRFFGDLLGLAEIEKPEPLGERRLYSEDPWGNRIELLAAGPS